MSSEKKNSENVCPYTDGNLLYCDYFIWSVSCTVVVLTCNLWVSVRGGVLLNCVGVLVICVLVFTVLCSVCTVFLCCFVYVYLFLFIFSVLV